jgi:cytochrome oxidase assembly protein ShyY1
VRGIILTPRWLALHVVALVLVASFGALGWWQLEVFRDSQARQELRELPPTPIDDLTAPGRSAAEAADRAVTASGQYLDDLVVPARVRDGVLGAYAVTPFESDAGVVVVVRGWGVTPDDLPPAPSGQVTVTGHLIVGESPGQATGGSLADGQIGYLAPDPVAAAAGRDPADFYAGYLLLSDEQPAPAAHPERLELEVLAPIRNVSLWQNLSYWAQWWIFAGAVVVFWVSIVRSGLKKRSRDPGDRPEPSPQPSAQQ